jgi:hypothetical protein
VLRLVMKKNRKKVEAYRFNGHPFLFAGSIHAVKIADLEVEIKKLEAKLANPDDDDDKKWTARWLERFQLELAKKSKGLDLKKRDRGEHRTRTADGGK